MLAKRGADVNALERIGILLELRIDFQDDVILVELSEDGRDLALAEGVVKGVVDVGGENAEARSGVAVDGQCGEETLVQLVAGNVAEFGEQFQFIDEAGRPVSKFLGINVFETVLELRAANAVFDGQVLDGLEEEGDTVNLSEFGLETANDIGGADVALGERLEIDLDAAVVQRSVCSVDADEGGKTFHGGVFQNDFGKSLLAEGHGGERNILRAFGNTQDDAGVLYGEKTFGNIDVEKNRADESGDGHDKSGRAKAEHKLQSAAVKGDDGIKGVFGLAVKPALFFFFLMTEELGAHHGSESERDDGGDEDGNGQGDGKFAEEPTDDVAHEEKRNEHSNERDGERNDGKTDLLGTFQRSLQRRFALFDVAADIFDHDDGVVDDEAGGNGKGHEGEIVEAVAEQIHDAKRANKR